MSLERHLQEFLEKREPPKTFCPSEVARSLTGDELREVGCAGWRAAMSVVRETAWEWRELGKCEILQKGELVGEDVGLDDIRGPIRIRRTRAG